MKTKSTAAAAFFNLRLLTSFALCSVGLLMALVGLSRSVSGTTSVTGGADPVPLINQNAAADAVGEGAEPVTNYGYCEASDSTGRWRTNGECVSHNIVGFCYIQPSADCPNGRRVHELSFTSCGGLGSAAIDLARPCSFAGLPPEAWANISAQLAKLTASNGAAFDYFGYSVAVSGDTAVVGAPLAKVGSNIGQGVAYVFVKSPTGWANMTETAKLTDQIEYRGGRGLSIRQTEKRLGRYD